MQVTSLTSFHNSEPYQLKDSSTNTSMAEPPCCEILYRDHSAVLTLEISRNILQVLGVLQLIKDNLLGVGVLQLSRDILLVEGVLH